MKAKAVVPGIVFSAALLARVVLALLAGTPGFRNPSQNMSIVFVKGGYALAAGLGYVKGKSDSPSAAAISELSNKGERGQAIGPADGASVPRDSLRPITIHPPGWSLIGVGLHRLTGLPISKLMRALGIIVDSAAAVLVYFLVLACLGQPKVAVAASLFYALFPPLAWIPAALYPPAFTNFFVILITYLIVLAVGSSWRRQIRLFACVGVLQGLAAYFRADYLLLAPFLALGLWAASRQFWPSLAAGVGMLLISVLVLLPWGYRNHAAYGRWNLTCTTFGGTAINGLAMYPNPWGFQAGDENRAKEAAAHGIDDPFGPAGDVYFRGVLARVISEHPLAYAKIVARRLVEGVTAPHEWGLQPVGREKSLSSIVYDETRDFIKVFHIF